MYRVFFRSFESQHFAIRNIELCKSFMLLEKEMQNMKAPYKCTVGKMYE